MTWAFWALAALFAVLGLLLLYRGLLRDRPRGKRRCRKCWYDMTGVPGLTCPECGRTHGEERQLQRRRRYRGVAALGVLTLALAFGVAMTPRVVERGVLGSLPGVVIAAAAVVYDTEEADLLGEIGGRVKRADPESLDPVTRRVVGVRVDRMLRRFDSSAYYRRPAAGRATWISREGPAPLLNAMHLAGWLDDHWAVTPRRLCRGLENPDETTRSLVVWELMRGNGPSNSDAQRVIEAMGRWPVGTVGPTFVMIRQRPAVFVPYADEVARAVDRHGEGWQALFALRAEGAARAVGLIDHPKVGVDVLRTLAGTDDLTDEAVGPLLACARNSVSAERRGWAVFVVSKRFSDDERVVGTLSEILLRDEEAQVRRDAVMGLVRTTVHRKRAARALGRALEDDSIDVRALAAWQLGEFGADAACALWALERASVDANVRMATSAMKSARQIRLAVEFGTEQAGQ
ncbi:MAG: HEAT repeat domain-containing protein [Phycisphaeraceae bacterium]|nr:HEAT repeat domain-containing protein [Phycisphaeraceae bacterium]